MTDPLLVYLSLTLLHHGWTVHHLQLESLLQSYDAIVAPDCLQSLLLW